MDAITNIIIGVISNYAHWIMSAILVVVFYFLAKFIKKFYVKSFKVETELKAIISEIKRLKDTVSNPSLVNALDVSLVIKNKTIQHLWSEYCDTLHVVKKSNGTEETRATIPSEVYFTEEALVDSPLNADFYKHLPGIMTGCAIISTFVGLIFGLFMFLKGGQDPSQMMENAKVLIKEVGTAFIYSATAIFIAMLTTYLEKSRILRCHQKVEEVCQAIDSLYKMGAGEEYMARLVDASESSDVNTRQLKDSLVNDLKVMMENLTERQVAAQLAQANLIGDKISDSIKSTFEPALGGLGQIVERTTREQSGAVHGLLDEVLAAFMVKLDDTFGAQMKGINETLNQSVRSMILVQESLQKLIADISHAGENATGQMAKQLEASIAKTTDHQKAVSEELKEIFNDMKKMMAEQQTQNKTAISESMNTVVTKMGESLKILEEYRERSANDENVRHQNLNEKTNSLYTGFSTEVNGMIATVKEAIMAMEKNISVISNASTYAIDQMSRGAEKVNAATNGIAESSNALLSSVTQVNSLQKQLGITADSLKQSTDLNIGTIKEYDKIRASLEQYIIGLKSIVESSQKEFSLKKDLVQEIDAVVKNFKAVEIETTTYLGNVNNVLQEAFKEFATRTNTQLEESFKIIDKPISESITGLNAVAQEISIMVPSIFLCKFIKSKQMASLG